MEVKKFSIAILLIVIITAFVVAEIKNGLNSEAEVELTINLDSLTEHDPIYIKGNDNFTAENGVTSGSGTQDDPYIIESWNINASTTHGIYVSGTTAYFVIRNCLIKKGGINDGIVFNSVKNGRIENTTLINNNRGIVLSFSNEVIIAHNKISSNNYGIYLDSSSLNNFTSNTLTANDYSVYLHYSSENIFENNNISVATGQFGFYFTNVESYNNKIAISNTVNYVPVRWYTNYGGTASESVIIENITVNMSKITNIAQIMFYKCSYIELKNSVARNGDGYGIFLYSSSDMKINNNYAENNTNTGISLFYSKANIIKQNTAIKNSYGIYLFDSSFNVLENNIANYNNYGIYISDENSIGNKIHMTNCTGCTEGSIYDPTYLEGNPNKGKNLICDAGMDKIAMATISLNFIDNIGVSDSEINPVTQQIWDFGDGSLPIERNNASAFHPSHVYDNPGTYLATYTIKIKENTYRDTLKVWVQEYKEGNPLVDIKSPREGEIVKGVIEINGSAFDKYDSITEVKIRIDSGPNVTANGQTKWNYQWDTTTVADGVHTIYAWSFNQTASSFPDVVNVTVDNTPPFTTHNVSGILGKNGWYTDSIKLIFNATDNTSGVRHTYYTINNGEEQEYSDPIILSSDGNYTIKYYSVDVAGNQEQYRNVNVKLDKTEPIIDIKKPESNSFYIFDKKIMPIPLATVVIGRITICASAWDNISGIERMEFYIDDTLKYIDTETPFKWIWDQKISGGHILKAAAYDRAGNNITDQKQIWIMNLKTYGEEERWAALIGVSDYSGYPEKARPDILKNVKDLYTLLLNKGWTKDNIKLLTGGDATKLNIVSALNWLAKKADKNDVALIYFATYGYQDQDIFPFDEEDEKDEYLVTYRGFKHNITNVRDDELEFHLKRIDCGGIAIIIDSSHSGGFEDILPAENISRYILLTSCKENETSLNSIFSNFIVEGLKGVADKNLDNKVSAEEAFEYVQELVVNASQGIMHPQIYDRYEEEFSITFLGDITPPTVKIVHPELGYLYMKSGDQKIKIPSKQRTLIIGNITIKINASDNDSGLSKVDLYIDDELKKTFSEKPYEWLWDETIFGKHIIQVVAYDNVGNLATDVIEVRIFNINI